jgi:hypothetical protein
VENGLKRALQRGGAGRTTELRQVFDVDGQVAKGFGVSPKGSEGRGAAEIEFRRVEALDFGVGGI